MMKTDSDYCIVRWFCHCKIYTKQRWFGLSHSRVLCWHLAPRLQTHTALIEIMICAVSEQVPGSVFHPLPPAATDPQAQQARVSEVQGATSRLLFFRCSELISNTLTLKWESRWFGIQTEDNCLEIEKRTHFIEGYFWMELKIPSLGENYLPEIYVTIVLFSSFQKVHFLDINLTAGSFMQSVLLWWHILATVWVCTARLWIATKQTSASGLHSWVLQTRC